MTAGPPADRGAWPELRKVLGDAFATATRDPHSVSRGTFFTDESGVVHPAPAPRFSGTVPEGVVA